MPKTPTPEWLARHEELHGLVYHELHHRPGPRILSYTPTFVPDDLVLNSDVDAYNQAEDDRLEAQIKGAVRKGNT